MIYENGYNILELAIDFTGGITYVPSVFVVNDFNSGMLRFSISQDITDKRIFVSFKMNDDTSYVLEATILDSKSAEIILPTGVLSVEGKVNCQIALYDIGASRLTNAIGFYYLVVNDLSDAAVTPSDNVPILLELITDVENLETSITESEGLRVIAEGLRVTAESLRVTPKD